MNNIINNKQFKKVPLPNTKLFINGELIEIVKLSWNNFLIEEYYCTIKCKLHIGCSCGIENLLKVFSNGNFEDFPRVQRVTNLTLLYGPPTITPMITRENDKGNKEYIVSDEYDIYGPLNILDEINFNNELTIQKKNKCYNRTELLKKYGHKINAAPVKPIKNMQKI